MSIETLSTDVAIIGGGLIGVAAAAFLRDSRGVSAPAVTLLEAGAVAGQASGANAGTLSLQNKHPLLCATCLEANELWRKLDGSLAGGLEFLPKGGLCVAHTEEEEGELAERYEVRKRGGLPLTWLDRKDLRSGYPWLSPSIRAATYNPLDAQANPLKVTFRLLAEALQSGVRVEQDCAVLSAEPSGEGWLLLTKRFRLRAGVVIVATGGFSERVGGFFGCHLPMERKVPQLCITDELPFAIPQVVIHVNNRLSLKQYPNGRAMIGGGWEGVPLEPEYRRTKPRRQMVAGNLALAANVVPGLSSARVLRVWSAMEGMSPDRLPYLGPYAGKPGLLFAVEGYGGFTLGLAFARQVVDFFLGKRDLPAWAAADRFDRRSGVELESQET